MTQLRKILLLAVVACLAGTVVLWAAYEALTPAAPAMATWAPQGALLALEAQDFAGLLHDWSNSEQQRAWLASDNYSSFSRSRLFSRLNEAQGQFAISAGLPPDMSFLSQVAGKESFFALYDIGNLEFLYITHMPASTAEKSPLLQLRKRFELRKSGSAVFYVRTEGDPKRTVAFAMHGDYLLLATREDLLAGALSLMQTPGHTTLQEEQWYATAIAAATGHPGDLRMTLHLASIAASPYFRNYWVQQNVSAMKQYTAAVSDLYRTTASFREERVLLPASVENSIKASDLTPVLAYLPQSASVYRATAQPTTGQSLNALTEKLLFRDISGYRDPHAASGADVAAQQVGSASDLETRIDAPPIPKQPEAAALASLRSLLDDAHLEAMLVTSSTGVTPDEAFVPIHSAVVLAAARPWNADAVEAALTAALRQRLTVGRNGLEWQQHKQGDLPWFALPGIQPLTFALQGNLCILASDSDTLLQSLAAARNTNRAQQLTSVAAGFNHQAERLHFQQLTAHLDHSIGSSNANGAPAFFSKNMRSLSNTFQAMDSMSFVEQPVESTHTVRQTVLYQWNH